MTETWFETEIYDTKTKACGGLCTADVSRRNRFLILQILTMDRPLERMITKRTPHLEMNSPPVALPAFEAEDWKRKVMCNDFPIVERYAPWDLSENVVMRDGGGALSPTPLLPLDAQSQEFGLEEIDLAGNQTSTITDGALLQLLSSGDTISANGEAGSQKETYNAFEFSEESELEDQSRQTQSPGTDITSTKPRPASESGPLLAPHHSNPTLCGLPLELLRFVVNSLDEVSQICLKFTNRYFHSMVSHKCVKHLNFRRRQNLISCLERDVGTYRALLQCSNCQEFRLRMLIPGGAPNRRWTPSRLSFREELRSCCKTLVPPGNTALRISQYGASSQELKGAECVIDVETPGMALILVCLHCSAEVVYTGEDVDKQRCTQCGCGFCPLVFMPRKLSVSLAAV